MDSPPPHSGRSDLSNPELLLCDFLWEHTVMTRCLADEAYPLHMNVRYSHGLSLRQLHSTLERMTERGLVTVSAPFADAESSVTLTPHGGEQWSLERNPDWERFIFEQGNIADNRTTIVAANESLGRHYIGARIAAGIEIQAGPIKVRRNVSLAVLPWKTFCGVTVLRFARYPTDCRYVHWDIYSQNRTWWTTLAELSTLPENMR